MRRMSDTPHLSDILQPHQFPCSPVRCPESSPCRHYRRLERHMLPLLTGSSQLLPAPAIAVARRHPGRRGSSSRSRIPVVIGGIG